LGWIYRRRARRPVLVGHAGPSQGLSVAGHDLELHNHWCLPVCRLLRSLADAVNPGGHTHLNQRGHDRRLIQYRRDRCEAIWHDPATLDAWRNSGGLDEAFIDVPVKLVAIGAAIGFPGALVGKFGGILFAKVSEQWDLHHRAN
jgi:hypothetical protein